MAETTTKLAASESPSEPAEPAAKTIIDFAKTKSLTPIKKKYKTVLLDPPWDIGQKGKYGASNHYELMTLDEIRSLPIGELTEEDSHLWLWTTQGVMPYAFKLLDDWGFTYRSIMTWVKPNLGLGQYLRVASEYVILATKGKCPVLYRSQPNWGFYPRQDHSHKPEEFFSVVQRVSPGPYLEMFARRENPTFDIWGLEAVSDIVIEGFPVPHYSAKAFMETAENLGPPNNKAS